MAVPAGHAAAPARQYSPRRLGGDSERKALSNYQISEAPLRPDKGMQLGRPRPASCRSAPRGTWQPAQGAPPPTAGLRRSSRPIGPISPRQYAGEGYPASATVRWTEGLSYPLSKRFWTPGRSTLCLQRRPESFVSWTLAPGSVAPSTKMLFLLSLAPVRGIASNGAPPKRAFPMEQRRTATIVRTPIPAFFSGRPRYPQSPHLDPTQVR